MLYQTHARIHLGHIRANLEAIRQAIGPSKLLLSVKANAYGHGALPVSRLAEACGVDWLGVATVPEGIQVRTAGISLSNAHQESTPAAPAISNRMKMTIKDFFIAQSRGEDSSLFLVESGSQIQSTALSLPASGQGENYPGKEE